MKTSQTPWLDSKPGFFVMTSAIAVVALLLRLIYSAQAIVPSPIRGDAGQYVSYAWNMLHGGIFSNAIPGSGTPMVPDAYRGPGYPALIYLALKAAEAGGAWYPLVLKAQAILGTGTVVLAALIGRRFLGTPLALLAGLTVALWPHLITATGYLLSETLFGFLLVLALWLSCLAVEDRKARLLVMAGIASGLACLVNPIYSLFPWLITALIALRNGRSKALLFLVFSMALPAAWAARNAQLTEVSGQPSRILQNFVQGSWPLYHAAYVSRDMDPVPKQILADIDSETLLLDRDPKKGLRHIAQRVGERPLDYLQWYALDKVYLLWDWNIRIGQGDIYIFPTQNSPFEKSHLWLKTKLVIHWLNPGIFWAAILFSLGIAYRTLRDFKSVSPTALILSLFFFYVTGLHAVLQAEPRYSIPYRPVEVLLALGFVAVLIGYMRRKPGATPGYSPVPSVGLANRG